MEEPAWIGKQALTDPTVFCPLQLWSAETVSQVVTRRNVLQKRASRHVLHTRCELSLVSGSLQRDFSQF